MFHSLGLGNRQNCTFFTFDVNSEKANDTPICDYQVDCKIQIRMHNLVLNAKNKLDRYFKLILSNWNKMAWRFLFSFAIFVENKSNHNHSLKMWEVVFFPPT